MATRYTQPQIGPIEAINEVHSALTPASEKGGKFRIVKGPAWTVNNPAAFSTAVRKSGTVVVNSSNGYLSRANPFQTGPLTVYLSHTPSTVSGTVGLWSIADTFQSGGPNLVIQRDSADLRVFTGASYSLTISGAFTVGIQSRIALSIFQLGTPYSQNNFLALNGFIYNLSNYASGPASKTNEFIGSGYNGQGSGDYGEYFTIQRRCSQSELVAFTTNPYQLFKPKLIPPLVAAALGGDATATGSPDSIIVSPATGSATGTANASATGSLSSISIAAATGTASAGTSATASGSLSSVSVVSASATASASGIASGASSSISVVAATGSATGTTAGNAVGTGSLSGISVSNATASASGSATTSGALASVSVTAATGTANTANNGLAIAAFAALSINPATGAAYGSAIAAGSLPIIAVSSATGSASGSSIVNAVATGSPASITVYAATGSAYSVGRIRPIASEYNLISIDAAYNAAQIDPTYWID